MGKWLSADEIAANYFSCKPQGGWISQKQTEILYRQWQRETSITVQYDKEGRRQPATGVYQGKKWELTLRWLAGASYTFPYNGRLELGDQGMNKEEKQR
jgi:hypothetical protein